MANQIQRLFPKNDSKQYALSSKQDVIFLSFTPYSVLLTAYCLLLAGTRLQLFNGFSFHKLQNIPNGQ